MSTVDPRHAHALIARHARQRDAGAAAWVDGTPLGNGRIGAVVWGADGRLILTVDHADFWDRRSAEMSGPCRFDDFEAVVRGEPAAWPPEWPVLAPKFDIVTPTRLPPSRIVLGGLGVIRGSEHDLWGGALHLDVGEASVTVTVLGAHDVIVVQGDGPAPTVDCHWSSDQGIWEARPGGQPMMAPHPAALFADHPAPERQVVPGGERIGHAVPDGGGVGLSWQLDVDAAGWTLFVSLAARRQGDASTVLADGAALLDEVRADLPSAVAAHRRHWSDFHARSWVSVPDHDVESLWYAEMAKLGGALRADGPPLGLQGPWSPDGRMPPWGGDLHHNVNVQMSYAPVAVTNHAELGESLHRYVETAMPEWRRLAAELFEVDGYFVPSATDDEGRCRHEYALVNLAFSSGPWLGQVLHAHWTHTGDDDFLRDLLWPFLTGVGAVVESRLQPGTDGRLHVPRGYSPELVPGDGSAWGPDPTIDLALTAWLFATNASLAAALGDDVQQAHWTGLAERVAAPQVDFGWGAIGGVLHGSAGGLRVRADVGLDRSHRHHSHLIGVHPLRTTTADSDDPAVRQTVTASLQQLMLRGPGEWVGFSVPWAASIAAHAAAPDIALGHLRDYAQRWVGPSTFHVQASHSAQVPTVWNELGGHMGGDALSLEAGFGFAAAVVDLLLQDHDGVVRVFPSLPRSWPSASFAGLRAAGGFEVAARAHDHHVVAMCIEAHRVGDLVVRFAGPDGPVEAQVSLAAGERWTFLADEWTLDDLQPVTLRG